MVYKDSCLSSIIIAHKYAGLVSTANSFHTWSNYVIFSAPYLKVLVQPASSQGFSLSYETSACHCTSAHLFCSQNHTRLGLPSLHNRPHDTTTLPLHFYGHQTGIWTSVPVSEAILFWWGWALSVRALPLPAPVALFPSQYSATSSCLKPPPCWRASAAMSLLPWWTMSSQTVSQNKPILPEVAPFRNCIKETKNKNRTNKQKPQILLRSKCGPENQESIPFNQSLCLH